MPDREKVIAGLECCLGANDCDIEPNEDCPYKGMCLCSMALRFDILALLKEQEVVRCKDCKYHGNIYPDYCVNLEQNTNDDFFCADGERK